MDEHYHSSHGAIQEAIHVFIKNGISQIDKQELDVFEMGFGTGLNALLTYDFAIENNKIVRYTGIEAYPVDISMVGDLNYVEKINPDLLQAFNRFHEVEWGKEIEIHARFSLHKMHEKIEDYFPDNEAFDIIYFDAFGPRAQGDMWSLNILEKMYTLLRKGGILLTYCAMGQFKRDLKSLGFEVESLPGPPGKREMTKGVKR
jgi:tRNA U34 5-methylaminomethyl-2-thiouridine-forming methyltransferase MnmC